MGKIEAQDLFALSWSQQKGMSSNALLVLYSPLLLILFIVRCFILTQFILISTLVPSSKFRQKCLQVICAVLGVTVSVRDNDGGCLNAKIFVANHTTRFDSIAVHLITAALAPSRVAESNFLLKALCSFYHHGSAITPQEIEYSSSPLILFPEGETTSGEKGLLTFTSLSLPEETVVQPIAIKVERPFFNSSTLTSSFMNELAVLLFLPNTHFTLTFLPSEVVDNANAWRENVQERIAQALNLIPTKYNISDKHELIKKLQFKPPSLKSMARAVEQKLAPQVISLDLILAALEQHGSVDGALKHLRKTYPPGSSTTFFKTSNERMSSFQERKRQMIALARQKYIEKHNLDITPNE